MAAGGGAPRFVMIHVCVLVTATTVMSAGFLCLVGSSVGVQCVNTAALHIHIFAAATSGVHGYRHTPCPCLCSSSIYRSIVVYSAIWQ